ncbi:MAG: hypothetical protein Q8904_03055 [Bacteroidota bacterium]|nr:hypothetical protein [Bacteroidota bacterium]
MKSNFIIMTLVLLFLAIYSDSSSQNLIKNGDFEYPITDELSLTIHPQEGLPGWKFDLPVSIINHTRLFPYSNFQCLLLPAKSGLKTSIRQDFTVDKNINVNVSYAFAASRIESGKLKVYIDSREIDSREYTVYWVPSETRLSDHMKWVAITLPTLSIKSGNHTLEFLEDSCKVVKDKQGDQRDMIEGFLIDRVAITECPIKNYTEIPTLDHIFGQSVDTRTLACSPAIGNFLGSVKSSKCLGGFETQFLAGSKLKKPAGILMVNDSVIFSQKSKWYPYQLVNKSLFRGVEFTSTMRLVFEKKGVLMQLNLENKTNKQAAFPLSMELISGIPERLINDNPAQALISYANNSYAFSFKNKPDSIRNTGEDIDAFWNIRLKPGEKKTISYVLCIDNKSNTAVSNSKSWNTNFTQSFSDAKSRWEDRWKDVFTPQNKSYSGYLPTFETSDKNLYELYYLSIVSFLETQQNNVYPTLDIAFGSNNEWANNQAYFWEISQFADMYALLEPKGLKAFIKMCLNVNIDKGNAINYENGQIVNHWYAVNDYALFKTIDSYLRINKDFDFLKSECNGKQVLDHLYNIATGWEKRFNKEYGLADYGKDPWSFFETNPNYIHMIPAMNAQNVWMLRSMADYDTLYGTGKRAEDLTDKANQLSEHVKSLYVPGEGVWKVKYPNGDSIISRHSYDFLSIGMTMKDDLTPQMKSEMIRFVETELLTQTNFMRAMSLKDQAAYNSDRSDHGPVGCYIGWPALTVQAIADLGQFEKAKNILSNFRNAFVESGMGQAIEFLVPPGSTETINRIGARAGASFLLSGSDYANTIIDGLMGYKPSINGSLSPYRANSNRFFNGKIINIRHGKNNYSFESDLNGVKMDLYQK